jgi:hypothetical protein
MLQDSSEERLKSGWEKHGQEERGNIITSTWRKVKKIIYEVSNFVAFFINYI